jgi:ABC-2 type transport system ATP-binding protein
MTEPVIATSGLRRTFDGGRGKPEIVAVDGVDLVVASGTIFGFLGPNGAGKTTTLRMLATLLPPSGGDARVMGADVAREPHLVRRRIGYVAQTGGSDPRMSARGELVMQGRLFGLAGGAAHARAQELLDAFELADAADRPVGTFSGGMRRRLDVALGMVHRPGLVFLDEPTTGLDPQARARMWDEVRRLREGGTTVFLTTHYLDEADALCDRLAIIDHGRIVAEGTAAELKKAVAGDVVTVGVDGNGELVARLLGAQPFVRETGVDEDGSVRLYVDDGEASLPLVLRILDGAGLAPQALALHRPSLDDVFLRQTGRSLRETAA